MKENNLIGEGKYEGDIKEGWFDGNGKFTYDNGVIYEGEFSKGRFHGNGTLIRLFSLIVDTHFFRQREVSDVLNKHPF